MAKGDDPLPMAVGGAAFFAAFLLFLGGVGVLVVQAILWLRDGYWTETEFRQAFLWVGIVPDVQLNWAGAQKIHNWVLAMPLSGGLVCLGVLVMWLGIWAASVLAAPARR